jgi:cytochrome P450
MFGTDVDRDYASLSEAFGVALEYLNTKLFSPIDISERWPTPLNRRFLKARRTIDDVVYRVIGERRRTGHTRDDLLGMLLEARDEETGESMSDGQLRDEVTTIFVAGHETTATTLAWTWYLLSKHPAVARRVSDELDATLSGRTPAMADLPNLAHTRMVIDEAMRLYPPAWMFARLAIGDDEVCGYRIPAGSMVMLSPYVMHRHPAYWDNPEGFDPERFLPERSADRPKYAYFPFGGGPRLCIGNTFSQIEAQLIVAMVAQTYRLHLLPGHRVEPKPISTLRPYPGVMMTVQKR